MGTGDLLAGRHVLLGDVDLCIIIFHVDLLDLSSLFDYELHVFSPNVSVGSKLLTEHVFTDRKALDHVGLIGGNPLGDDLAILVKECQVGAGDLFAGGHILFGDLHFRVLILHFHLLLDAGVLHLKFHIFCPHVAVRGKFLAQHVLSNREHFDVVRFFFGSPCLYNISFLVKDRQLRSGDLLAGGDICLGDPDPGNIILHLNLLYLHGVLHGKNDGFRSHIAICRLPLNKLVFPVGIEVLDQVRLLFRNPLVHNIPGIVKYLEVCSRDLTAAGDVGLGDFHFCGFIYECKVKGHCSSPSYSNVNSCFLSLVA